MADRSVSGSGGVRNIRAMFEAKNEQSSPPSRGRSPAAGSESVRSSSSRPMSKVRTSFVAVEKSGHFGPMLGLRKTSDAAASASSTSKIEEEAVDGQSKQTENSPKVMTKTEKVEDAIEADTGFLKSTNGQKSESGTTKDLKATPPQIDGAKEVALQKSREPTAEETDGNGSATEPRERVTKESNTSTAKSKASLATGLKKAENKEKSNISKPPASQPQSTNKKPPPIQSNLSRADSISKSRISTKTASPKVASPKTSVTKAAAPKKTSKETSQPTKPKSPAKPVRHRASDNDFLSRMMRPTASSSSKTHDASSSASSSKATAEPSTTRTSAKRASDADNDFLSRMMRPTASSASKTQESGPGSGERPNSSKSHKTPATPADNGFLARMMKPTTSSASKTHDKQQPPNSPPQQTESPKSTRTSGALDVKQQHRRDMQAHKLPKSVPTASSTTQEPLSESPKLSVHEKTVALESPTESPKENQSTPPATTKPSIQHQADEPTPTEEATSASADEVALASAEEEAPVSGEEVTPAPPAVSPKVDEPAADATPDSDAEPAVSTQSTPQTSAESARQEPDSKIPTTQTAEAPPAAPEENAAPEIHVTTEPVAPDSPFPGKSSPEIEPTVPIDDIDSEEHTPVKAEALESPAVRGTPSIEPEEEIKEAAEKLSEDSPAHDAITPEPSETTQTPNSEVGAKSSKLAADAEKEEATVAEG